jgi:hypothetical protein
MIVQPRAEGLFLIRQTDHAALSGLFAENWGRSPFVLPVPQASVRIAATHHDDGWYDWEAAPRINPATQRPYQFTDLPTAEHAAFYRHGIDQVRNRDGYAGLLVCMHLAGLYRMRLGPNNPFGLARPSLQEEKHLREILGRLEEDQERLRYGLAAEGVPERLLSDPFLTVNYRLLQFFDRLSLYFCVRPPDERRMEVPRDYEGNLVEMTLRPLAEGKVVLRPYPFRSEPLGVLVKGWVVPDRVYVDDRDFQTAFAAAPVLTLRYDLCAG